MNQQELKRLRRMVRSSDQKAKEILESYLTGISDDLTRLIFKYYYLDGWSWQRIACKLDWTDESTPRKIAERYLKNLSIK